MPSVRVRDNEPFEVAMRRFKRTIEKTGLLTELRAVSSTKSPPPNASASSPPGEAPLQAPAQPAAAAKLY